MTRGLTASTRRTGATAVCCPRSPRALTPQDPVLVQGASYEFAPANVSTVNDTITLDPGSAFQFNSWDVDATHDTIALAPNHTLQTGDGIVYTKGSGEAVGNLTEGATYFVRVDPTDRSRVTLHPTRADALAGTARIDLTSGGTESGHHLTAGVFRTGDAVVYTPDSGTGIGNLKAGKIYYVRQEAANPFKVTLYNTKADALAGSGRIHLGSAGTSSHQALSAADDVGVQARNDTEAMADPSIDAQLNSGRTVPGAITGAFVTDAGGSSDRAEIVADGSITIQAANLYDVDAAVGQAAVGAVSLGAGVAVVSVKNDTQAFVGSRNVLRAGAGSVLISASDNQWFGSSHANGLSGAGGILAVNGAVTQLTVDSHTDAHVGSNAQITVSNNQTANTDVTVHSSTLANARADSDGYGAGGVSVQFTLTKAKVKGTTQAYVDGTVTANGLDVFADATRNAEADIQVVGVGVLGGDGGKAEARVGGTADAYLGSNARVTIGDGNPSTTDGNVRVWATSIGTSDAGAGGGAGARSPAAGSTARRTSKARPGPISTTALWSLTPTTWRRWRPPRTRPRATRRSDPAGSVPPEAPKPRPASLPPSRPPSARMSPSTPTAM